MSTPTEDNPHQWLGGSSTSSTTSNVEDKMGSKLLIQKQPNQLLPLYWMLNCNIKPLLTILKWLMKGTQLLRKKTLKVNNIGLQHRLRFTNINRVGHISTQG